MPTPRERKKVLPSDTERGRSRRALRRAQDVTYANDNPLYSAVWLYVELCPENTNAAQCDEGHWSLKVVHMGEETLYRVAGHHGNFSLQIINGVAPDAFEGGLLLPAASVDAKGLRTMLASVTVDNVNTAWNSQQWVFDVLGELLADVPSSPNDVTLFEVLTTKAWNFAG